MSTEMTHTWDGLPISPEPPYGTAIVVYKKLNDEYMFLLLHRKHQGPDYAGDWAWGSPSGSRFPGELLDECVKRELFEETGLVLPCHLTSFGSEDWYVYHAEAPSDAVIVLSHEHDLYEWVTCDEAVNKCLPDFVGKQIYDVALMLQEKKEG